MSDRRYRSIISRHIDVTRLFIRWCHPCKFPFVMNAPEAKNLLIIRPKDSDIYGSATLKRFLSKPSPDLSGSFDKYFITSSTIISINLNIWMLSCPFQYKSPDSFESFEFGFCVDPTKYLSNASAFRFFGIDLTKTSRGIEYYWPQASLTK